MYSFSIFMFKLPSDNLLINECDDDFSDSRCARAHFTNTHAVFIVRFDDYWKAIECEK